MKDALSTLGIVLSLELSMWVLLIGGGMMLISENPRIWGLSAVTVLLLPAVGFTASGLRKKNTACGIYGTVFWILFVLTLVLKL